jgi:hypothetical protein
VRVITDVRLRVTQKLPQLMLNNLEKILQSAKFLYSGGTSGF